MTKGETSGEKLLRLLRQNTTTGLGIEERKSAWEAIFNTLEGDEPCSAPHLCLPAHKALLHVGMCGAHAAYALVTGTYPSTAQP
jgi:hypothetical protein